MRRLGFREYLPAERQSDIITSFRYPEDPAFDFDEFYQRLAERGFVIYPGKVSHADCFRIGTIGRISVEDVNALVSAIEADAPLSGGYDRQARMRAVLGGHRPPLRAAAQRRFLSSAPILRVSGQTFATPSTTRIVPMPPPTTESTGPK